MEKDQVTRKADAIKVIYKLDSEIDLIAIKHENFVQDL